LDEPVLELRSDCNLKSTWVWLVWQDLKAMIIIT